MNSTDAKPWRYGPRSGVKPGASWTAGGAYRVLPTTRPRPDRRRTRRSA
ncbi:hypothetical protein ACFVWG_35400 [Kribbella sp. NPDC058245]